MKQFPAILTEICDFGLAIDAGQDVAASRPTLARVNCNSPFVNQEKGNGLLAAMKQFPAILTEICDFGLAIDAGQDVAASRPTLARVNRNSPFVNQEKGKGLLAAMKQFPAILTEICDFGLAIDAGQEKRIT